MILDLLKFGIIFFLPTLIGKGFKFFSEIRNLKISILPWKSKNLFAKIVNSIILIYIISKLASIFVFYSENFFSRINCRIDSPSYIIRNNFRSYLENWAEGNAVVSNFLKLQQSSSDIDFENNKLYQDIYNLQTLSEQLKSKEKKEHYSKFGENAFLNCDYCTSDSDFLMYLAPGAIFEYSIFLVLLGTLSSCSHKSNWRIYGLFTLFICLAIDGYGLVFSSKTPNITAFQPYDFIFGDDLLTLRYEKISFIRNIICISFLLIAYLFDYEKDSKLDAILDQLRDSLNNSLAFLQSTRIQNAAVAIDENLGKFINESARLNKSKLAAIISDPSFREKVAETGHKLNIDQMFVEKTKNIEDLFEIIKNSNK